MKFASVFVRVISSGKLQFLLVGVKKKTRCGK